MIMPAHPDELKECAVRLCLDALKDPQRARGRFKRVGDQLGINSETLRGWVRQVQVDAGDRPGTITAAAALNERILALRERGSTRSSGRARPGDCSMSSKERPPVAH